MFADMEKNDQLEKKLRELFLSGNSDVVARLKTFLEDNNTREAYVIAHTLKTSALLINEANLSNISGQLEHCLRNNEELPDALLDSFAQEMTRVLAELEKANDRT